MLERVPGVLGVSREGLRGSCGFLERVPGVLGVSREGLKGSCRFLWGGFMGPRGPMVLAGTLEVLERVPVVLGSF